MDKIRLQKYFTDCGILSRRAAETEIAAGNVTVNGHVAAIGEKILPGDDRVFWNGKEIKPRKTKEYTYIMLNKPRGYVTSLSDPQGRKCVTELIRDLTTRVYPVGRLDMISEGCLLLTDDGDLANKLTHPRHAIPKIYRVKVSGTVSEGRNRQIRKMCAQVRLDVRRLSRISVGNVKLNGLAVGKWRYLEQDEIDYLKKNTK